MISVLIMTIPHKEQRYPTVGDWVWDGETLKIFVSDCKNHKYEFLVALHEFIEAMLCKFDGVNEEDVTKFDMDYEKNRPPGDVSEPGDSIYAPYHIQHKLATLAESFYANNIDVDWGAYEKALNDLDDTITVISSE